MPTFSVTPFAAALIALLSFALLARLVFADVAGSTSFKSDQSINDFGGGSTSTSFSAVTTGGQFVTGESTSTNFQLATGYEYFDSFAPKQENWRWYDDETNETPMTPLENENVAPSSVLNDNIIKLRVTVKETAGIGQSGTKFKLQFSTSTDFSTGAVDVSPHFRCSTSQWCYTSGAGADNALISSAVLSDPDPCSGSVGDGCGTHNESGTSTSSFIHKKSAAAEYEFTIVSHAAAANTVYFFRLFDTAASSAVPLDAGKTYPSLSAEGGTLSFSVSGIPAASPAGGVTTNIDTTATGVPFGTLPIGTPLTGAHRLAVSTNASGGYEVYVYEAQGLVGTGAEITPISGTNDSPSDWSSGCPTSANGCFGYHTAESVLAGGSTRFAADDTYAQFSQTPSEVAYNSTPITDKTTDVVYKIEAHQMQPAQEYSTNITYIVVPVY